MIRGDKRNRGVPIAESLQLIDDEHVVARALSDQLPDSRRFIDVGLSLKDELLDDVSPGVGGREAAEGQPTLLRVLKCLIEQQFVLLMLVTWGELDFRHVLIIDAPQFCADEIVD
jgi:hypothetical protein